MYITKYYSHNRNCTQNITHPEKSRIEIIIIRIVVRECLSISTLKLFGYFNFGIVWFEKYCNFEIEIIFYDNNYNFFFFLC